MDASDIVKLEEYRHQLCRNAEFIDGNKRLHVLLRLTEWHQNQKLKSAIGGALLLISMAEIIRRALESALKVCLPEEDEMGLGQWMHGARKILYGTERVMDAPKETVRDFLVDMGLDFGIRTRCYVEGETELGAMNYALGDMSHIEIINLRGQVVAKMGKGVAFRASLESDLKKKIFSFVILDGDRSDFASVIRKAAEDNIITGAFTIAKPDIEFENFNAEELVTILSDLAAQQKIEVPARIDLLKAVQNVRSGTEFFNCLKPLGINRSLTKGTAWGEALMKYAIKRNTQCSLLKMAEYMMRTAVVKFQLSRDRTQIDLNTGAPFSKEF